MALKSIIFDSKGGAWLNSFKRFCKSFVLVPQQNLTISKIPAAQSLTQPGRAVPIPMQGPAEASSEVYSATASQAVVNQGIGSITTTGSTAVTGIGTKFLAQLQVGDTISTTVGSGTIATVTGDTTATTVAPLGVNTAANFFFVTPALRPLGENIFVKIQDQAWRRYLMNRDVPAMHVFGTNQKPLFMKETLLLETDQTLMLEFLNYSTAGAASMVPIMEGRKWQLEALKDGKVYNFIKGLRERKQFIQPYWLTLDKGWSTLAATVGTSTNEFLTCTGDITLVLFNLYAIAIRDSDGVNISDNVTVTMQDAKTQRSMQVQPMPISSVAGIAANPMRMATPWIVEPQTQIRCTFVNNSGTSCKVYLTFHGVAIYTGSSWRGSTLTNKNLAREGGKMYQAMSEPQIVPAEPQG